MFSSPIKLKCQVKNYDWGKIGKDSLVALLSGEEVKASLPYAELWLGAHESGSATLEINNQQVLLSELIKQHPEEILGKKQVERFSKRLPFLFKVLSIKDPLSIQLHPDETNAAKLNKHDSKNYPDIFHKPELAIALGKCELLWGFREHSEIVQFITENPELVELLNVSTEYASQTTTFELYKNLFQANQESIEKISIKLFNRLLKKQSHTPEEIWILKLKEKYPKGNIGIFSFYFLNLLTIHAGDAIFTTPGVVHAYLSGDLVECMASSDNVVRAGLTTKYCDIDNLLRLADYSITSPNITSSSKLSNYMPVPEFRISEHSKTEIELSSDSLQILFSLNAVGRLEFENNYLEINHGSAILIPAICKKCKLKISSGILYQIDIP